MYSHYTFLPSTPAETVSSQRSHHTKNPYALSQRILLHCFYKAEIALQGPDEKLVCTVWSVCFHHTPSSHSIAHFLYDLLVSQ